MKRLFPTPFTSVAIVALWLLLNQTVHPAHLLLAAVLAVGVPLLVSPLQPLASPSIKRPFGLLRLLALSSVEIVRSAFNVSRMILFVKPQELRSQFIRVPLDLHNPYGLAVLSCLINITPGTVWVEILPERHELSLHVFDVHDEQWWIQTIKSHYEQPLIDVFQ